MAPPPGRGAGPAAAEAAAGASFDPTRAKYDTIEETIEKQSGARNNNHGYTYQFRLLMLFMFRAYILGYECFSVGAEVAEAYTFDDVVFVYRSLSGKVYRFLQAKHREDDNKTIKATDLLKASEENSNDNKKSNKYDFSILKYFISYRKIIKNMKIKLRELKDLIVCTNIDLDDEVRESFREIDISADRIFGHKECYNAKQYKIKINKDSDFYKELVLILKENHFNKVATNVAKIVFNKQMKPDILMLNYSGWLVNKVFNILETGNGKRCITFQDNFLHDRCKGDEVLTKFKAKVIDAYRALKDASNTGKEPNPSCDIDVIFNNMSVEVPKNFVTKDVLSLEVANEEIEGFFEKFVLAVNQPNEKRLSEIIADEMGEHMNLIDGKLVCSAILEHIICWFNEEFGRFKHKVDVDKIFECCKENIARLGLVGLTLERKLKYKTQHSFKDNEQVVEAVKKFIENSACTKRILTVYYKYHFLNVIKILQATRNTTVDRDIFCDMEVIQQLIDTAACPIKAFRSEEYNCLIIDFNHKVKSKHANTLRKFFEILKHRSNKHIILIISQENQIAAEDILQDLYKELQLQDKFEILKENETSFSDFTNKSQEELLRRKVEFQGQKHTLKSIIKTNSELITEKVFSKLITNKLVHLDVLVNEKNDNSSDVEESEQMPDFAEFVVRLAGTTLKLHDISDVQKVTESMFKEMLLEEKVRTIRETLPSLQMTEDLMGGVDRVILSIRAAMATITEGTVENIDKCKKIMLDGLAQLSEAQKSLPALPNSEEVIKKINQIEESIHAMMSDSVEAVTKGLETTQAELGKLFSDNNMHAVRKMMSPPPDTQQLMQALQTTPSAVGNSVEAVTEGLQICQKTTQAGLQMLSANNIRAVRKCVLPKMTPTLNHSVNVLATGLAHSCLKIDGLGKILHK